MCSCSQLTCDINPRHMSIWNFSLEKWNIFDWEKCQTEQRVTTEEATTAFRNFSPESALAINVWASLLSAGPTQRWAHQHSKWLHLWSTCHTLHSRRNSLPQAIQNYSKLLACHTRWTLLTVNTCAPRDYAYSAKLDLEYRSVQLACHHHPNYC